MTPGLFGWAVGECDSETPERSGMWEGRARSCPLLSTGECDAWSHHGAMRSAGGTKLWSTDRAPSQSYRSGTISMWMLRILKKRGPK